MNNQHSHEIKSMCKPCKHLPVQSNNRNTKKSVKYAQSLQ